MPGGLSRPLAGQQLLSDPNGVVEAPMSTDPIVERARAWMAADKRCRGLEARWRDLESSLFCKAKQMDLDGELAVESDIPEAVAMRQLDVEIAELHREMDGFSGEAARLAAVTIEGAIAKIALGLMVQGPFDWRDHAYELVDGGLSEMRAFLVCKR